MSDYNAAATDAAVAAAAAAVVIVGSEIQYAVAYIQVHGNVESFMAMGCARGMLRCHMPHACSSLQVFLLMLD